MCHQGQCAGGAGWAFYSKVVTIGVSVIADIHLTDTQIERWQIAVIWFGEGFLRGCAGAAGQQGQPAEHPQRGERGAWFHAADQSGNSGTMIHHGFHVWRLLLCRVLHHGGGGPETYGMGWP